MDECIHNLEGHSRKTHYALHSPGHKKTMLMKYNIDIETTCFQFEYHYKYVQSCGSVEPVSYIVLVVC